MAPSYVLAVMGVTGAGKSSFIKLVTGDSTVKIGHSQAAETKVIKSYEKYIRGRKFSLVDTPGFDDEDLTDSEVLKMLVDWLVSTYRSGQRLSGILYLHRVTDTRMRGSSVRNLRMFKQLIGDDFHKNLTLGMTCWSLVPFHVGLDRESELKANSDFWKTMISKGARVERMPDDVTKARNLVYEIASHNAVALQTQRDVVDRGISFSNLAVTKTVNYDLDQVQRDQAAERKRVGEELQTQLRELQEELARVRARNERVESYANARRYCSRKRPTGICDKVGCWNKLQRYLVTFHCCSCHPNYDNYWHCGPCGNDCGNEEHPSMSRIENEDDCVVM